MYDRLAMQRASTPTLARIVLGLAALATAPALAACGDRPGNGSGDGDGDGDSGGDGDGNGDGGGNDGGGGTDGAPADAPGDSGGGGTDAAIDGPPGVITGGPCLSGQAGATAYRIRWANAGGKATVVYEVNGLPDKSRDKAGAYGYVIGFTPQFVDPFLGDGGLLLDSSSFVDLELTTVGVAQIASARLSIFGRSFNTTASGSFNWQTFDGTGATPSNLVSNAAPYKWYAGDMTAALDPSDSGVLIRIKAGPSSGSLVVHRIELCLQAS